MSDTIFDVLFGIIVVALLVLGAGLMFSGGQWEDGTSRFIVGLLLLMLSSITVLHMRID